MSGWSIFLGVVAGIGTTIATLSALEAYISGKFVRAVESVLMKLQVQNRLDDLDDSYQKIAQELAHDIAKLEEQVNRCKDANMRQHAGINWLKIHQGKLESAVRAIADDDDDRTISAIFEATSGTQDR